MKNVIVITGIGGCGKSTFAAALAAHFARNGIHTLLIGPDSCAPAFGMWVPTDRPPVSLGKLLENPFSDTTAMASAIFIPHGMKENLGLLGFLPEEKRDQYSPPSGEKASTLLFHALQLSDLVIVDGTNGGDGVTDTASKVAAMEIRLVEPTPRGWLSIKSLPPKKTEAKTIWAASLCCSGDPVDALEGSLGVPLSVRIPWTAEAREKLNEGSLFQPYREKRYRTAVEQAAAAIREATA